MSILPVLPLLGVLLASVPVDAAPPVLAHQLIQPPPSLNSPGLPASLDRGHAIRVLREDSGSQAAREVRQTLKETLRLQRAAPLSSRARLQGPAAPAGPGQRAPQPLSQVAPPKIPLEPLPGHATTPLVGCEKTARIEALEGRIADEADPSARDRLKLVLAGHLVGNGDWAEARALYEELKSTSADPAVLEATARNLRVVDKKLEALDEPDASRREQLELDLAEIHDELGHQQAARHISRTLEKASRDEAVRAKARELLDPERRSNRQPDLPRPVSATAGKPDHAPVPAKATAQ